MSLMSMFETRISSSPGNVDLAFIALHGTFGEDDNPAALEERGVAYTGEGVEGSKLPSIKSDRRKV